ncbi:hypothetical protein MUO14_07945 [Halobacillus shinanisalinarum]|uniref:Uncharacterized protein n=1 Tax=Halobacillus shinanisalinarum TaxID=2932258 RepID=A0ABY4H3E8_9BACI|nr:hypothetical protein [Halobacillus shinanisalinarum]UOQ94849.1 hypothetical protein MUO14_07945 [Halobacillus shinanisalinarum]
MRTAIDPLNPFIFKMFAQIGLGWDRSIHTTWKRQKWKNTALTEGFQPGRTTLVTPLQEKGVTNAVCRN